MGVSDNREDDRNSPQPPAMYECRPDHLYEFDIPPGWKENKTATCAVTWPSETPFTEISECCTGPVHVFHACFHYCATDLPSHSFLRCALKHMDAKHIGVRCNAAVWPNRGETTLGPAKTAGSLASMNRYSLYLISAALIILLACAVTQSTSMSGRISRRIWTCFAIFLGVLVLLALCVRVWSA